MAMSDMLHGRLSWNALLALFAAALALPVSLGLTPDASWLLTVSERVLQGETLYRDILEYNPPFSVWLYMAPAWLNGVTGIRSEVLLYLQFCLLFFASYGISAAILSRAGYLGRQDFRLLFLLWIALFVLLPLRTFAQREHFALLAFMPWLSLAVVRWQRGSTFSSPAWAIAAAALSCAALVMTKPYYALTIIVPVCGLAFRWRSVRPFFNPENVIGATITVFYAGSVLLWFPDYFGSLYNTLAITYLPVRTPLAMGFFLICGAALGAASLLLLPPFRWPALAVVPALAASGHFLALLVMGKAFTYHALPAIALSLLSLASVAFSLRRNSVAEDRRSFMPVRKAMAIMLAAIPVSLVGNVYLRGESVDEELLAYLQENHAGKTFISVSESFADSHPLVRLADGKYLGPHGAMLASSYGNMLLEQKPNMDDDRREAIHHEFAREREVYANAILTRRPAVLLVSDRTMRSDDATWKTIAETRLSGRAVRDIYVKEAHIGGVSIYRLTGNAPTSPAS